MRLELKTLDFTEETLHEEDDYDSYGAESGWVEAKTHCDHLPSLSSDLTHIPIPSTPCSSRFVNKHMLEHYQQTTHSIALSFSDLSVWCFACDSYLDAQLIQQLRPFHETAYILKFGQAPPFRSVESSRVEDKPAMDVPSSS
ncbi:hypothetical protein Gohar_009668 [Gossypium harknessii]|uniref:UBP-type domain-containing protein n=1 Tax=Gossypium harknessii TaxID=34285 RepID=A0A7J9GNI8_9ROSI|nr:hypothetical protein [Gossypium harknessii]